MASTPYSVIQMTEAEGKILEQELLHLDPKLSKRMEYMKIKFPNLTYIERLDYVVTDSPILWAKVYLGWEARDYQFAYILEGKRSKKLVLRLGRRLGKSDGLCVLILWYAYTQYNKGPNNQYDILICTPYETQIDLLFKRLGQLIDNSPMLKSLMTKSVYHHIEFTIGSVTSVILGLTAGANNASNGGNSTRGQRADVLVLDEMDYIGSSQVTNIMNIRNEAPERIRVICASTPSGKHEEYYRWCTGASKRYAPRPEDIKENKFGGYVITEQPPGEGNGWTEVYAPSVVNKELLKTNPDTNQTYLEDIREELSEMRYAQEVMAEFGEEEMGVYKKQYIVQACEEGKRIHHRYYSYKGEGWIREHCKNSPSNFRMLGVDWDKYCSGTTLVGVEFDRMYEDIEGNIFPIFKVMFREEISRGEFTYVNAMNRIIQLDSIYQFDHIAIDRGYGETQLELLHKYGIENPSSGMAEKVVGYQFSQKIDVRDPYTRKVEQKHLKPFMVNTSVNVFEKCKIVLDPTDKLLISQLEEYRVKSISSTGMPVFTDENEHAIDALNLCLLVFEQNHGELMRKVFSSKIALIQTPLDIRDLSVKDRDIASEKDPETIDDLLRARNGCVGVIRPLSTVSAQKQISKARQSVQYSRNKF